MSALLAILLSTSGADDVDSVIAHYQQLTRPDIACAATRDKGEIIVCGARKADRFRLPFVTIDIGDPAQEGVWERTRRLQARTTPCQELKGFVIGCGAVGVSASIGGSGSSIGGWRPLAP